MRPKKYKLDIKEILQALDTCDKEFYSRLSSEEKKSFQPWTVMRFASSSTKYSEHHILMINAFVNDHFSSLSKHPELLWKLLTICGVGTKQFHPWISPPRKRGKNKIQELLHTRYPTHKQSDLEALELLLTIEDIEEIALEMGHSDKEIKEILK